jgi:hypothetical protein
MDESQMMPMEMMPPQDIYGGRMPMSMDQQTEGALMYQLDSLEIIAMIEHMLKGEINKDGTWVIKKELIIMNDQGTAFIMSQIRSRIDRNTFLSNLDDDIIERKLRILHMIISKNLALRYEEWGMETHNVKSNLESTLYIIMEGVENALHRARDKTTLNYFKPQLRIAETQQMMPQRKKILGLF